MMKARTGSIVNLSSVNQINANPNLAAYTAAKGGIRALTKQLAVEYGPYGIRCNAVAPGLIRLDRIRMSAGCDEEDAVDVEGGADDREFLLSRAEDAACRRSRR